MQIDLSAPEGNTMVALGIARRLLKQADRGADADKLFKAVMDAESAKAARKAIAAASYGCIEFVNSEGEVETYD